MRRSHANQRRGIIHPSGGLTNPADAFLPGDKGFFWDLSDLSTMWTTAAKTTQVTGTGQNVGYIADKSGNGYDLVLPAGITAPVYTISGTKRYLTFPAGTATTTPYLRTASTASCGLQVSTCFIGFNRTDNVLSEGIVVLENAGATSDFQTPDGMVYDCGEISPQNGPRMGGGTSFSLNCLPSPANSLVGAALTLYQYNKINAAGSTIMDDTGTVIGTAGTAGTFNANSTGRIIVGRRVASGTVSNANKLAGQWGGAFHINRTLSSGDALGVRNYMNAYMA